MKREMLVLDPVVVAGELASGVSCFTTDEADLLQFVEPAMNRGAVDIQMSGECFDGWEAAEMSITEVSQEEQQRLCARADAWISKNRPERLGEPDDALFERRLHGKPVARSAYSPDSKEYGTLRAKVCDGLAVSDMRRPYRPCPPRQLI